MAETPKDGEYIVRRTQGVKAQYRHGLTGNKLPRGLEYIEKRVNALRRQVEALLLEAKGEIGLTDAAAVNSILKWERHGQLAAHWLRKEMDALSPADRLKFSAEIAKASDQRDKNIRALGLDLENARPWLLPMPEAEEEDEPRQAEGGGR